MDKEKLKAYGVDYENAVKRFAGNEALYEKFLKKLTEDDHLAIGEQAMKENEEKSICNTFSSIYDRINGSGSSIRTGSRR